MTAAISVVPRIMTVPFIDSYWTAFLSDTWIHRGLENHVPVPHYARTRLEGNVLGGRLRDIDVRVIVAVIVAVVIIPVVIIVVVVLVVGILAVNKRIRNDIWQVRDLELVKAFAHFQRHLVDLFLGIDRSAEEELSLRIFRRQDLLSGHGFEFQLPLVVGEDDG